jgi:oligo-1,6-glucosidase
MQWDSSANAGFSQAKPWLKVHKNSNSRNVAAQEKDQDSLFNFYRLLIRCRRQHPALLDGDFIPVIGEPKNVLAYLRRNGSETIMVVLNFSRKRQKLQLEANLADAKWEILVSTHKRWSIATDKNALILNGDEALVLKKTN